MAFLAITGMIWVTSVVLLIHFIEQRLDRIGLGTPVYVRSWLWLAVALAFWMVDVLSTLLMGIMLPSGWLDPGLMTQMVKQRMEHEGDLQSYEDWRKDASLQGYPLLTGLSLLAPLFVVATFVSALAHILRHCVAMRRTLASGIPVDSDEISAHVQTVRILFLPPIYGLMSLQAVSSMLEVSTNHCFASHHFRSWSDRRAFSHDLYALSFSVADVYEAYALLVFAVLIMQVLRQQVTERVFVAKVDTHSRHSHMSCASHALAQLAQTAAPPLSLAGTPSSRTRPKTMIAEDEEDEAPFDSQVVSRRTMPLKDYVRTRTQTAEELTSALRSAPRGSLKTVKLRDTHLTLSPPGSPRPLELPAVAATTSCGSLPGSQKARRKTLASFRQLSEVVDDLVVHTKGLTTLGIKLFCITCAGGAGYDLLLQIFGFYDILPAWFGTQDGAEGALQTRKAKDVSHIAFYGAGFVASFAAIGNVIEVERGFHHYLDQFNPVQKFLGVKVIVSLAFFQSIVLVVLPPFCSWTPTRQNLFYASLLCLECFLISLLHVWAWPPDEGWYRETYLEVVQTTSGHIRQVDEVEPGSRRDGWVKAGVDLENGMDHEDFSLGFLTPPDSARTVRTPLMTPQMPLRVSTPELYHHDVGRGVAVMVSKEA